jgi:hypothetical protein
LIGKELCCKLAFLFIQGDFMPDTPPKGSLAWKKRRAADLAKDPNVIEQIKDFADAVKSAKKGKEPRSR